MIGFAGGKMKATNRAWEDYRVFDLRVSDEKIKSIREYVDTQALAQASEPVRST